MVQFELSDAVVKCSTDIAKRTNLKKNNLNKKNKLL